MKDHPGAFRRGKLMRLKNRQHVCRRGVEQIVRKNFANIHYLKSQIVRGEQIVRKNFAMIL